MEIGICVLCSIQRSLEAGDGVNKLEAAQRLVGTLVVFEDSFNGLKSGRAAKMCVVGITTTNSREAIEPLADFVIDNYNGFSLELL